MSNGPAIAGDCRIDRWMGFIALAGAALLFLAVPLRHPLMLFDALAPVLAWQLWRRRKQLREMLSPGHPLTWLALAAAWALFSAAVQLLRGASPLYDTAIIVYMFLVCGVYCTTELPPPGRCAATAAALLGLCLLVFLVGTHAGTAISGRLFYIEGNLLAAPGTVLARRFQFLFTNPNLLGSAYVLPLALAMPWLHRRLTAPQCRWRGVLLWALALLVACLPLLHSVSKHLVLTFGLCCGLLASWPPWRRYGRVLAPLATALLGLLLALTVWFRTYPAVAAAPWVEFHARSNYSTHQEVYCDIIRHGGISGWLWGYGADELRQLYPRYADRDKIAAILEAYYGHRLDENFAAYMDPHNEYLNAAAHFGLPALACLVAAVACLAWRCWRRGCLEGLCFCVALAAACLWDDLSSKRWLWLVAGLAMQWVSRPAAVAPPAAPRIASGAPAPAPRSAPQEDI